VHEVHDRAGNDRNNGQFQKITPIQLVRHCETTIGRCGVGVD
jgi:hypothetical protein